MMPFPSRDDAAAALIARACGHSHDFPGDDVLRPTGTETGRDGATVNVRRIACRRCGTIQTTRWRLPEPAAESSFSTAVSTFEAPEPGDVPGIAERARRLTDEEYAAYIAECGFPADSIPKRRAASAPRRLDLRVQVRAWQFALLDRGGSIGEILPVPPHAESAGIIDAVPGAVLFWAPIEDGELPLTVVVSSADPGPDRSYDRFAEISCRFHTGRVALREIGGRTLPLPRLPADHGDHRLRLHTDPSGCLLHIWSQARTRPL
ncbi:hypothetical protein [Actinomadura macrotermitis]|uniref:Uncharacterized protein n=1 Tax=Actinomadura macrotermitis TaxID=2585200 RepID=A0A7K0BZH7_9ACTN|nr:hypothetical protein [Actinomadura macrotermitis]MQY06588.1 hypothetical protein [Actinomadura macrotermitis]